MVFIYYKERDIYHYKRYATFIPRFRAPFIDTVILWPIGMVMRLLLHAFSPEDAMDSMAFYAMPAIYYVWLGLELITMISNRRGRAFQDYFAGTVVVRAD